MIITCIHRHTHAQKCSAKYWHTTHTNTHTQAHMQARMPQDACTAHTRTPCASGWRYTKEAGTTCPLGFAPLTLSKEHV